MLWRFGRAGAGGAGPAAVAARTPQAAEHRRTPKRCRAGRGRACSGGHFGLLVYPPAKIPVDGIKLTVEVKVGAQWVVFAEDRIIP